MNDHFIEAGFTPLEHDFKDLDIYICEETLLIVMCKFRGDKKAFRIASNHLDEALILELGAAFDLGNSMDTINNIVITSAHKVAFSRGAKIEDIKGISTELCKKFIREAQELTIRIQNSPKTVVAALNGLTFGGGMEIALACDYRIASNRENVILGLPEAHLGLLPAMGGTMNCCGLIGKEGALAMIQSARMDISSEEAKEMGLVDQLTEPQELIAVTLAWLSAERRPKRVPEIFGESRKDSEEYQQEIADYLSSVSKPKSSEIDVAPYAHMLLPFLLEKHDPDNLVETLRYELEVFCFLQQTEDCREGIQALIDEREPVFQGA